MKRINLVVMVGFCLSSAVVAEEKENVWAGEAELGVVATSGNTETQSISAKAKVETDRDKWKHALSIDALNTESGDETTAERYGASGQTNYKFSERQYVFARVSYENDRFSGYDYHVNEVLGYGASVIKEEALNLDVEAGAGAHQSKVDGVSNTSEAVFRLAGNLGWELSKTSFFTQELSSNIGEEITTSKSVTALKTQVNGSLAMKVSYTINHVSEVPEGKEKSDKQTAVTLVYGF